jgi:hypothetical protein
VLTTLSFYLDLRRPPLAAVDGDAYSGSQQPLPCGIVAVVQKLEVARDQVSYGVLVTHPISPPCAGVNRIIFAAPDHEARNPGGVQQSGRRQ